MSERMPDERLAEIERYKISVTPHATIAELLQALKAERQEV